MRIGAPDERFVIEAAAPVASATWERSGLGDRVAAAVAELRACRACPRDCAADRIEDEATVCGTGRWARVASAFPHHGEEDCLRGWRGSGTIFFAGCNLRCVFCQNADIAQGPAGRPCPPDDLAALMLELQGQGCHNINLVTPEHVVPQIVEALAVAVPAGLRLPIVYNTSAYDGPGSLRLMDGLVDVYMPDFKFWSPETARRLVRAADYPEVARTSIAEMHRQVGVLRTDRHGIARRGVLVRHLVMPGMETETAAIMDWLAAALSPDTYVNLMGQYRPAHRVPGNRRYADIDRRPQRAELIRARAAARDAGLWRFDERW